MSSLLLTKLQAAFYTKGRHYSRYSVSWKKTQKKVDSCSDLLTKEAHSACIVGCTGCGKLVFALDLLEGSYKDVFEHIVILCGTVEHS